MLNYLGSLPMWLQVVIILVVLILVLGFIGAVIYKIVTAERIKAGPGGVEIEDEPEPPAEYKASTRKFNTRVKK